MKQMDYNYQKAGAVKSTAAYAKPGGMSALQEELRRSKQRSQGGSSSESQQSPNIMTFAGSNKYIKRDQNGGFRESPMILEEQPSMEDSSMMQGRRLMTGHFQHSERPQDLGQFSQPNLLQVQNMKSEAIAAASIGQYKQPGTARGNKSQLMDGAQQERLGQSASQAGSSKGLAAQPQSSKNGPNTLGQYQRQSTFNSDAISAIRPLKSTTSASQLKPIATRSGVSPLTTGKHKKLNMMDAETTRDFLLTEDFNDSANDRAETDGNHPGAHEEDSDYGDAYGDESCSSDESISNVSNPFREYQEMLGDQKHVQNHIGHYVLFMDPDTYLYYRKDLRRNDYIMLEPFQDEAQKRYFDEQNKLHLYKIRKLLILENFSWNFKGEADLYRRRHFPRQFLQNEASDYPCYVFNSELSKAFNRMGDIDTVVDLTEFKEYLQTSKKQDEKKAHVPIEVRFKESLVTSTKEFIKNILRQVYQKYNAKLKPRPTHNLILKADGYREYFEGNYQLLQYERVRACLRKNEPMRLILTEIPKNYRDHRFPPIFRNKLDIPRADKVSMQGFNQLVLNSSSNPAYYEGNPGDHTTQHQQGGDQFFRFRTLKHSSPYFWYPPVPNLQGIHNRMEKTAKSKMSMMTSNLGGGSASTQQSHMVDRSYMRRVVYVAPDKELVSLTEHRDKTGGTTIPKQTQQIILHSGECNWRFKFKLVGIERLNVLFNEIRNRVATDNKQTEPRNVTLKHAMVLTKRSKKEKEGSTPQAPVESAGNNQDPMGQSITIQGRDVSVLGGASQGRGDITSPDRGYSMLNPSNTSQMQMAVPTKGKGGNIFTRIFKKKGKAGAGGEVGEPGDSPTRPALPTANTGKKKVEDDSKALTTGELPTIIKQSIKQHAATKTPEEKKEEEKYRKKKKKKGHGHGEIIHLKEDEEKYLEKELRLVHTPFCNFANRYDTMQHYQNIMSLLFGKFTPVKIQLECTLYHGCEVLTEGVLSNEVYFNNTLHFDQWITFGNLRYCQIPMKTRVCFNLNLLTREGQILTIGCVSMNLFDEKGRFRNGMRELNVWPFYELDERLGCMKEYNGMTVEQTKAKDFIRTIDSLFTKIVVEFESFITPLYYSSRDEKRIEYYQLSTNTEDTCDKKNLINVQIKNQDLAQLKKYLNCNPLSRIDDQVKRDLFKCREHYQTHPQGLPIFLRSVQWNRPIQVNEVYKMLANWAPMKPEEAISLLDAKFPDERVRQYAVQRISLLSDDDLATYMLQFSQALLYEEQHYSPLAEMLIERSLRNPYVVGHAFYWSLKSNLYLKVSYERYYVLLEQFLMLCGKFKEDFWIQQKVNEGLRFVSEGVVRDRYGLGMPFDKVKDKARQELRKQRREKLPFLFTVSIDPKIVVKDFKYDKLAVFSSKKVPLMITALNQQPGGDQFQFIFKNGDDLRQDILTLQIIYIMDKIWLANNLDLAMTPYKVLGTDCEQGYLEFVGNTKTLAAIQFQNSVFHTFTDDTIESFMTNHFKTNYPDKWKEKLKKARNTFIRSTAGYCVASYILGLGDRHPDNIMINYEEGNFLHIDFGHFLGNVKKKFGIKRERDPFVFTKEIAFFVNGGPLTQNTQQLKLSNKVPLTDEERHDMSVLYTQGGDDESPERGQGSPGEDSRMSYLSNQQQQFQHNIVLQDDSDIMDDSMKSRSFRDFEEKCCQAYNILRKDGHQLINMFLIMLSAGMPELKQDQDVQFLVNRLDLGISEQEASNKFKKEIQRAMQTYSRRFDNFIHNIKAKYNK